MDLEASRDQVTATLCYLSKDRLTAVCNLLKYFSDEENEPSRDTSRRKFMKIIKHKLDDVEKSYMPDDAVQYVRELLSAIGETRSKGDARFWCDLSRPSDWSDKGEEWQGETGTLEEERKTADAALVPTLDPTLGRVPEVTICREYRLSGQVGEGGQREKLSYTNLLHQMENGLRKGHSESEVIVAVIRAISPGLKLRDMLELKIDLTLPQLKTVLKGHYREDDTSD